MKSLIHHKTFLSRLCACLATPLRWLKLDGNDAASRMMRHELLLFVMVMLVLGGVLMLNAGLPMPQEPLAAAFAKGMTVWLNIISLAWFMGAALFVSFHELWLQCFRSVCPPPFAVTLFRLLRRITLFQCCGQMFIWLCLAFGDDIIRAGAQEQAMMLALVPALLAIAASRPLFGGQGTSTAITGNDRRVPDDAGARFAALSAQLAEQLRQHDAVIDEPWYLRSTATHEAGHMLVCAALRQTPQDITLRLEMRGNTAGYIKPGFGIDLNAPRFCNDPVCIRWLMLLLQAGAVAERHLTGREGLGAGNDSSRWLACARIYLANLCDDTIYYADPDNEQEQTHNVRELNALKQQQRALLAAFFDLNDAVLRDLSASAQKKRTLRRDDLLPFFARVRFPEGFPRPDLTVLAED